MIIKAHIDECIHTIISTKDPFCHHLGYSASSNQGWVKLSFGSSHYISLEGNKDELKKLLCDLQEILEEMTEVEKEVEVSGKPNHIPPNTLQ